MICAGVGLAFNSTIAILEAILGIQSAFQRTPKFRIEGQVGEWRDRRYVLPTGSMVWGEIMLTVYSLLTVIVALERGQVHVVPFLLLYVFGFAYVSIVGLAQSVKRRRPNTSRAPS